MDPSWLAIAVANTANASSILLPTSNVTNLLVMQGGEGGFGDYLRTSFLAWLVVTGVTIAIPTPIVARATGNRRAASLQVRCSLAAVVADLLAMFVIASSLRSLLPSGLSLGHSILTDLGGDGILAAVVNNLPAAAAIQPVTASARWAGVLGMAIGPNLLLTGSVATVVCRRMIREGGGDLDPVRFSALGLVLAPLQLAAGATGLLAVGAFTRR